MSRSEECQLLQQEIRCLAGKRKAVILAHYYQRPEVQQVADFVGDSLQLAQQAAATEAEAIVFCGVFFMAESAKILSPDKLVLLPEYEAGCPLADTASAEAVRARKAEIPDCLVVSYVNSSAEVKAESDIICTSSNAVRVVNSVPADRDVLFLPDRNLGSYVARQAGRVLHLWDGACHVHDRLRREQIIEARKAHPGALVVAHPECRPEVLELADQVTSTAGMIRYVASSAAQSFIIATEEGLLYQLRRRFPERDFYPAAEHLICPNMKLTTLEKVRFALEELEPKVEVDPGTAEQARRALSRMLELA